MSSLRDIATGEDYPAAARKHCTDARVLLNANRADGAAYLSGYGIECVLKSLVQVETRATGRVAGRHNLQGLGWRALDLATLPTGRTWRYLKSDPVSSVGHGVPPAEWSESLRYHPEFTVPPGIAAQWLQEADRLYSEVIGGMAKDGVITL